MLALKQSIISDIRNRNYQNISNGIDAFSNFIRMVDLYDPKNSNTIDEVLTSYEEFIQVADEGNIKHTLIPVVLSVKETCKFSFSSKNWRAFESKVGFIDEYFSLALKSTKDDNKKLLKDAAISSYKHIYSNVLSELEESRNREDLQGIAIITAEIIRTAKMAIDNKEYDFAKECLSLMSLYSISDDKFYSAKSEYDTRRNNILLIISLRVVRLANYIYEKNKSGKTEMGGEEKQLFLYLLDFLPNEPIYICLFFEVDYFGGIVADNKLSKCYFEDLEDKLGMAFSVEKLPTHPSEFKRPQPPDIEKISAYVSMIFTLRFIQISNFPGQGNNLAHSPFNAKNNPDKNCLEHFEKNINKMYEENSDILFDELKNDEAKKNALKQLKRLKPSYNHAPTQRP